MKRKSKSKPPPEPEKPDALRILRQEEGALRYQINTKRNELTVLEEKMSVLNELLQKCDPEYVARNEARWVNRIMFGCDP